MSVLIGFVASSVGCGIGLVLGIRASNRKFINSLGETYHTLLRSK